MRSHSFTNFLDSYGQAHGPQLRYRDGDDFGHWQTRFREKLEELRGPVPERIELQVELLETIEEQDHTRYLLEIPVNAFSALPAYLLIPHDLREGEQRGGLLVSHGHVPHGMETMCGVHAADDADSARRAYALFAVRSGYVVLAPAWWGWPGRDGHRHLVRSRDPCNVIQMAASMYGLNVLSLHIQDAQAAIDVLAARPEVDADRIGCLGNSYGGRTAMWFAIFDQRIQACVAAGGMNLFRERSLKLSSCGIQYFHGLLRYGDVAELFSLIAPRPLQLQAGEGDDLITPWDRDLIDSTVREAYSLSGAEDRFDYVLHQEGHFLLWEPARAFLERAL